jgi:hypothetical protein
VIYLLKSGGWEPVESPPPITTPVEELEEKSPV